jgi:cytochrome c
MIKRIPAILGVAAASIVVTMVVGGVVSAQGGGQQVPDTHGVVTPEKVVEVGKTVPLKVTPRVYDKKVLMSAPVLSEEAQIGRALWLQKCAYCHDGVGQPTYKTMGPWLGAETVQTRGEAAIKAFINSGTMRMPGFKYALDGTQMDDLLAYIKTITADQKPTAAQLAGRNAAPGRED